MRILQLTKHYPPYQGGIESVTFDLTEGLNNRGVTCDVLCANDIFKLQSGNVGKYHVTRASSLGKMFSTSISPQLLLKFKQLVKHYDIIHVHFPDPLAAMAVYLARPKAKILIHWHSDIIKQKSLLKLFLPLQNWILNRADIVVGTSPKYVAESSQLAGHTSKSISIPLGISTDKLTIDEQKVAAIKNQHGGKRIIFSLGRLVYYKGFEYLIDAARHLPDDAIILIGGQGPLKDALAQRIKDAAVDHKVKLVGKIPQHELGSYFKACDIFCLPSIEKSEAFGVVQLEAMMLGKPIISTDVPGSGISWVNKDNGSGFIVPPKDALAIADRITRLLADPGLYAQFSEQCLNRFNEHFTADKMVNAYMEVYKKLLAHNA